MPPRLCALLYTPGSWLLASRRLPPPEQSPHPSAAGRATSIPLSLGGQRASERVNIPRLWLRHRRDQIGAVARLFQVPCFALRAPASERASEPASQPQASLTVKLDFAARWRNFPFPRSRSYRLRSARAGLLAGGAEGGVARLHHASRLRVAAWRSARQRACGRLSELGRNCALSTKGLNPLLPLCLLLPVATSAPSSNRKRRAQAQAYPAPI